MAGLHNLVPSIPKRAAASAEEDMDNGGDYADADLSQCVSSSQEQSNSAGGSREEYVARLSCSVLPDGKI